MSPTELTDLRTRLDDKRTSYTRMVCLYKEQEESLSTTRKRLTNAEDARALIQEVARQIQQEAHHQIAAVVTQGLQTVFDPSYVFQINFEKKRGKTEAELIFERDGKPEDPLGDSSGGAIDVAALTLRVSCLSLSHPEVRPLLVLDEPFKNVSEAKGYLYNVPPLLETLSKDMGIQIIMVTHIDELKVGKIVEVG